ncbi:restriction endonuclease subunit S [Peribacillus sp. NPDC096448]|uniref:restriction endonuclease subunit S n=1 Tax=Peribacillus sp. NPDC096448 TaxID=3364395 RepID=UPI0037FB7ADC
MLKALGSYYSYKNSGIEWIGDIPSNWEIKKLKFLGEAITGLTYSPNDVVNESAGILVLRASNIQNGVITYQDNVYVDMKIPRKLITRKNDILICSRNGSRRLIGKCAKIDETSQGLSFGAFTTVFRSKYSSFLFYAFQSPLFKFQIGTFLTATINQLTIGNLNSLQVPLPSTAEQEKIVSYLDSKVKDIDYLLAEKERLINLLEKKRQAMITEAVTKGLNPNVKMKDSSVEWIGEIPEHWEKTRLDFIARVKARLGWKGLKAEEYVEEGYIFLSTPNLKGRYIDFENVNYITEERYLESPEIMLEVGDVLLAKDGSTLGITNVVRSLPNKATVNSSVAVLRPKEIIDSVYFYYYLTSTYIQDTINQIKDGMGVPHLFQADIKKFPIILPPLEEQKEISQHLDNQTEILESTITMIKQQIQKLKEYRQSLIYEAVTGKIDVRDFEIEQVRGGVYGN